MDVLFRMGLDALPPLAEALNDDTPTKTITSSKGGPKKTWQVNELVAILIWRIADRDFVIGPEEKELGIREIGSQPGKANEFKKAVLDWHTKNRVKTLAERKIDDVKDAWFRNRFDAIEWLGQKKIADGRAAISARVDAILREKKENTTIYSELSLCAFALGRIGNKDSLPQVQRVCQFLIEQKRWSFGSGGPYTLFEVYHGLALLGKKDVALSELKAVYDKHWKEMEPSRRQEFKERLEAACKW